MTDPSWCQLSATNQVELESSSYLTRGLSCCLCLLPYACHHLFLSPFLSFPFFSLVTLCLVPCFHTYKMEGSAEVPIQNSFVVPPAPYQLSSCRGDPGEPYHNSICKCTCTWTTAWACWDWELIYANLRETVTTQSWPPTLVVISPRQHNS